MLRVGPDPAFAPFTSLRSSQWCASAFLPCSLRLSPCRQPTLMLRVGLSPAFASLAPHRSPRLPPPLLPCLFRSLHRLPTFMLQAGQAPAFSAQTPHRSVSVHSANQVYVSLMLCFNNHLVCSIHSRYPFCVHSSLSQSLCSLMLRSTTLSFAQFAQLSCSMAMLRSVRQVKFEVAKS